jgi:hypothetical protein
MMVDATNRHSAYKARQIMFADKPPGPRDHPEGAV